MTSTCLQVTFNVCRHELYQELSKFGDTNSYVENVTYIGNCVKSFKEYHVEIYFNFKQFIYENPTNLFKISQILYM